MVAVASTQASVFFINASSLNQSPGSPDHQLRTRRYYGAILLFRNGSIEPRAAALNLVSGTRVKTLISRRYPEALGATRRASRMIGHMLAVILRGSLATLAHTSG